MELNLTDFVVIAVLVGLGCALSYVGLWLMLRQSASERQQATESQLSALTNALKSLEARVAEQSRPPELQTVVAPIVEAEAAPHAVNAVASQQKEKVTPETLVMIAAAVTAFLGKKVRIRSAKMLRTPREVANPWSQQGRASLQASHDLRSRG